MLKSVIFAILFSIALLGNGQTVTNLPPAFFQENRRAFKNSMPTNSTAIFFSNPVQQKSNDVNFPYKANTSIFYLAGVRERNSVLVLFSPPYPIINGQRVEEALFIPGSSAPSALWEGPYLAIQQAQDISGIKEVRLNNAYESFLAQLPKRDSTFFEGIYPVQYKNPDTEVALADLQHASITHYALPVVQPELPMELVRTLSTTTQDNFRQVQDYLKALPESSGFLYNRPVIVEAKTFSEFRQAVLSIQAPPFSFDRSNQLLGELRQEKKPIELDYLRKAIDITVEGQKELMKAMRPELTEKQVQALQEFVFYFNGALDTGYPSIVGAGEHSCVLHYTKNEGGPVGNSLVLMDLGAEYEGYTADITRTIPGGGTFSREQKMVYNLVLEAQNKAIQASVVGAPFFQSRQIAMNVIDSGLVALGIAKSKGMAARYLPHGISHYIGLDVHDPGTYSPLQENDVITIEPGIYIPEGSPCSEKWWGIGVRIEDNILIKKEGPINLSEHLPREVEEIEALMKSASLLDKYIDHHQGSH